MSKTHDISVLGAGITGLMNAYMLAQGGHNITLYDPKGFPAENASLMAGGMLAPYSEIEHMNEDWVAAGLEAIDIWNNLELDCGLTQNGSLLIAHSEDRHILERFKTHLPREVQEQASPQTLEPALSHKFTSGLYLAQEAHLDPLKTMTALCEYLANHKNVTLKANKLTNSPTHLTIDCRGIAANDPDLRGVKGETLTVRNREFTLSRPMRLMHPRYPLYIIPRGDNIFMIGATVIESGDSAVSLRSSMELMSALYTLSSSFAEAEIISLKAGIRPSYADNLPRIKQNGNVISCNGMFRHGFLLAPVMAACVKDMVENRENRYTSLFKGTNDGTDQNNAERRYKNIRSAA